MKQKILNSTITYWSFIAILGIIAFMLFSSHIYAQSPSASNLSFTQKRLNALHEYQATANKFAWLSNYPEAKKIYDAYLSRLNVGVTQGDACRVNLEQQTSQQRKDCDRKITADYKKARNFYRLLKYQELINGAKNICVKADMGVNPPLLAKGISNSDVYNRLATQSGTVNTANPKETGLTKPSTVYLCADGNGTKKLRVRASNGHYVKLTTQELARPELQISALPSKDHLDKLIEKLDIGK